MTQATSRPDLTSLAELRRRPDGPCAMIEALGPALRASDESAVWIDRVPDAALMTRARELAALGPEARSRLPLYGVPFAVKDNIDVAGLPTTAACPAYGYLPERTAPAIQRLLDAGAILLGKTNLDQFATGLVGVRSPYGTPRNPFDAARVPGGSSSGSAVAVATGLASFAIGTDTAGSGRVPAGFNNIVGLKPTRGVIPCTGVVPACRSLDCLSIFAGTARDAATVLAIMAGPDSGDPFSRPAAFGDLPDAAELRVGVPDAGQLDFFGERDRTLWLAALATARGLGIRTVPVDLTPFAETAALLYAGPWVAERDAAVGNFIRAHPEDVWPVTRQIITGATAFSATDTFQAFYRLAALRRAAMACFADIDLLLVPTAPGFPTLEEVERAPLAINSRLGAYTNFVNLLDLAAIALPSAIDAAGLPFGVTLIAPAFSDRALCRLGQAWQRATGLPLGATGHRLPDEVPVSAGADGLRLAVVGAHLRGQPLNHELVAAGGRFERAASTAPVYRLHALSGGDCGRPGLVRVGTGGTAIEVEIWRLPPAGFGRFVAAIPSPLGIGSLQLEDGTAVPGFLCEAVATADAPDISHFGGWRAYRASRSQEQAGSPRP